MHSAREDSRSRLSRTYDGLTDMTFHVTWQSSIASAGGCAPLEDGRQQLQWPRAWREVGDEEPVTSMMPRERDGLRRHSRNGASGLAGAPGYRGFLISLAAHWWGKAWAGVLLSMLSMGSVLGQSSLRGSLRDEDFLFRDCNTVTEVDEADFAALST
jgi:hypothetical protein